MFKSITSEPVSEEDEYFEKRVSFNPFAADLFLGSWSPSQDFEYEPVLGEQKWDLTPPTYLDRSVSDKAMPWKEGFEIALPQQEVLCSPNPLVSKKSSTLPMDLADADMNDEELQQEIDALKKELQSLEECQSELPEPKKTKKDSNSQAFFSKPSEPSPVSSPVTCPIEDTKKLKIYFQNSKALKAYIYANYSTIRVSNLRDLKQEFLKIYINFTDKETKAYSIAMYELKKECGSNSTLHTNTPRYQIRQLTASNKTRVKGKFTKSALSTDERQEDCSLGLR